MDTLGDVTRELFLLMKSRDIVALSIASPYIAEQIDKLRYDSDFYHKLTEREFDKELDRRDGVDWYTIYHNLTIVEDKQRIAAVSSHLDSLAVKAELSGTDDPLQMFLYYKNVRSAKIFQWMLESGVDDTSVRSAISNTLRENVEEGEKMLEMILLPPYDKKYNFTRYEALREVIEAGNLEATLRISRSNPKMLTDPTLLDSAVNSGNPDLVRLLTVRQGQAYMQRAVELAIIYKKDKVLQALLPIASTEAINQVIIRLLNRYEAYGLDRSQFAWALEHGLHLSLNAWERLLRILYLRSPRDKNLDILALRHKYATITRMEIDEELYLSDGQLDTYWTVAQFLLEKSRTSEEILAYLRDELFTDDVQIAVRSIFNPTIKLTGQSAEYRALILYLMYPDMSMDESTKYLREVDKYSDSQVLMSNLLIKLVPR